MSYEYDENNGLQPKPPKKNNNDLGSWIFIAVMFAVAWPVGLILLLSKLSEGGGRKMRQQAREAWQRTAAGSAEAKSAQARSSAAKNTVRKVTETPNYSDKGAKTMKIIGAVVGILGCVAMLSAVSDNLSYAYHYNEWWYFARQLFYPMGMMAGGVSLLLGSGAMKRRQRRFATYLRTAGQKAAVPPGDLVGQQLQLQPFVLGQQVLRIVHEQVVLRLLRPRGNDHRQHRQQRQQACKNSFFHLGRPP